MKLTKRLLAMALAGVMLLTILTGCSGGKSGDRLVEEYMDAYYHSLDAYKDVPITNDVPEIKTVAENSTLPCLMALVSALMQVLYMAVLSPKVCSSSRVPLRTTKAVPMFTFMQWRFRKV